MKVGVLALQGAVSEHVSYLEKVMGKLGVGGKVVEVRTNCELEGLDGLVMPGGESTTLSLLMEKEGMFETLRGVPKIFGTCAGAILLSKNILEPVNRQKSLGLLDVEISRNGYGRQLESFEAPLETKLGNVDGVFIRAPVIEGVGEGVRVLAEHNGKAVAVQQGNYLATTFHPELSGSTLFHEHFLKIE
ncbi:MAG: pyridoxal 5'-phosphate synthase glutaminase subunit PdxT [bacterium]|nr:pyridoxal 5'-phosphate synthase glutaminase subunit PdxT [bacterium]